MVSSMNGIKITVGGKERIIRFTMRSYAGLQAESKKIGLKFDLSNLDSTNMLHLAGMLWAGLLSDDPSLTLEEVLDWEMNPSVFAEPVAEALNRSLGEAKAPVGRAKRRGQGSTGAKPTD